MNARRTVFEQWRKSWEEKVNEHLALAGSDARIDRRSYAEQINACLARELEISLPRELDEPQRVALVHDFVHSELTARGVIADVAYHNPVSKRDGHDNPHAHILYTTRTLTPEGLGKKNRDLDGAARRTVFEQWRQAWEEKVNEHLALAGFDARIDRRSYVRTRQEKP